MATHAQIALMKRREAIATEIRKLTTQLKHIDAAIKIMEPEHKLSSGHGRLSREILEILLKAEEPMTIQQIADAINAEAEQVKDALKGQRYRGRIRGIREAGKNMVWEVFK